MIKKNKLCDSCGDTLKAAYKQNYWKSNNDGRVICFDCMNYPLDVLQKAFHAKTFSEAKKIIRSFDEECEESFLRIEYN